MDPHILLNLLFPNVSGQARGKADRLRHSYGWRYYAISGGRRFRVVMLTQVKTQEEHKPINKAYRYAYIELKVSGETLKNQSIDYGGESLLKVDEHTYQFDAMESESEKISYRLSLP